MGLSQWDLGVWKEVMVFFSTPFHSFLLSLPPELNVLEVTELFHKGHCQWTASAPVLLTYYLPLPRRDNGSVLLLTCCLASLAVPPNQGWVTKCLVFVNFCRCKYFHSDWFQDTNLKLLNAILGRIVHSQLLGAGVSQLQNTTSLSILALCKLVPLWIWMTWVDSVFCHNFAIDNFFLVLLQIVG